ncbi:dephospho-CoA triphosphoribosyl transferase family protein [Candidatus Phytoplasma oryzae]|uniref:triphosphoribosyl-dephospho-CoA synthase n=1 Tax=Candidatus Phytoplasma oryzae TaxID=203274 RepID=A0A139JQP1_9MOLU|nr:triphosphoribosyl-dephospho-CoA synthase [Candidatus Phytoplasma oryzae]KXT29164.1 dephospho-CoA triphosphoribosyl transferase family protein [Candidatus Phytoplasma oryzae]
MELLKPKIKYLFNFWLNYTKKELIEIAVKIIELELSCNPALGLVSFKNSGCHLDMNIKNFLDSKNTFYIYFQEITLLAKKEKKLNFIKLRNIGLKQEKRMFHITKNINTHKGLVFSFGIIFYIAIYSLIYKISFDSWSNLIQNLVKPLEKDFLKFNYQTKGEKIFKKYHFKGARGEALEGYKKIFKKGIPFIEKCLKNEPYLKENEIYLCLLIFYLKEINDTTLISKIGYDKFIKIKKKANILINFLLKKKFDLFKQEIINKNESWKKKKISPGGCADLSVVTLFLFFLYSFNTN